MIFKLAHLEGIRAGKISLAFRKWKKPSVRKGSLIKTAVAVVEISNIEPVTLGDITNNDAVHTGFNNLESLLEMLDKVEEGNIYKIGVRFYSDDPRIALRERVGLTQKDFDVLKKKLDRLDGYSKEGDWTVAVIKMIGSNPKLRAADLASIMNREKDALKINIRKLKNMGLTISHEVGYTLSPLGEELLKKIQ